MLTNTLVTPLEKVVEYGLQDKDAGKEAVFIKLKCEAGEFTWFGSLKAKQPGKEMGARDVTFQTMMKLGWDGDTDKFAAGLATFNVPSGTTVEIADDEYAPGKIAHNKVTKILVPGYGMGVKKADEGKTKSVLAGMKRDIDSAKSQVAMQSDDPGF